MSDLDNFVNTTQKGNVAVIVPLYGYWADDKESGVNGEVLDAVLKRVYSHVHQLYIIFVANPQSVPNDPNDPYSVANILIAKTRGGNVRNVPVARHASYDEYVREGIQFALDETNSQFIVVLNPWVVIQEGGIDAIVERANRSDEAKIISGYNVRPLIGNDDFEQFNSFAPQVPKEEWDISMDFMAMPRFVAEMLKLDPTYTTRPFQQVDLFQQIRQLGYAAIISQRVPIFTFDFPWNRYETEAAFEADRTYFTSKWRFDPGLTYAKE